MVTPRHPGVFPEVKEVCLIGMFLGGKSHTAHLSFGGPGPAGHPPTLQSKRLGLLSRPFKPSTFFGGGLNLIRFYLEKSVGRCCSSTFFFGQISNESFFPEHLPARIVNNSLPPESRASGVKSLGEMILSYNHHSSQGVELLP